VNFLLLLLSLSVGVAADISVLVETGSTPRSPSKFWVPEFGPKMDNGQTNVYLQWKISDLCKLLVTILNSVVGNTIPDPL
jgi:hypothetical protein